MRAQRSNLRRSLARGAPVLCAVLATSMSPTPAPATPTGLNNIPTADTPPDRSLTLQFSTMLSDERDAEYLTGFKMGLQPWSQRFELGLDSRLGQGESGPPVAQFKYALPLGHELPTVALGIANLAFTSDDRDRAGQPQKYFVATQDFRWFRGTAGYQFQQENNSAFFGFDKTIKLFDRDLMLRADYKQIDDQDQWLGSVGFIYFINEQLALESWVSQPFQHGEPTFTLKLNVSFTF